MHAHGTVNAPDRADMKLVSTIALKTAEPNHQLGNTTAGKGPFDFAGGFTRITNEHAFGTEISNLAGPRLTIAGIYLSGKFYRLSGAAATLSRIHELPDQLQSRHVAGCGNPANVPEWV
jgi:hypothetical protein